MFNLPQQLYLWLLGSQTTSEGVDNVNSTFGTIANAPDTISTAVSGFFSGLKLWLQIGLALIVGAIIFKLIKTFKK